MALTRSVVASGYAREIEELKTHFSESAIEVNMVLQKRLSELSMAAEACAQEQALLSAPTLLASNFSAPWRFDNATFNVFQMLSARHLATTGARTISWDWLVTAAQRPAYEAAASAAAATGTLDATLSARMALPITAALVPAAQLPAPAAARHLAVWDVAPSAGRALVQFDVLSNGSSPDRQAAVSKALAGATTPTDLLPFVYVSAAKTYAPATLVFAAGYAPAPTAGDAGATQLVGACAVGFEWAPLLEAALPAFANTITAVVTSPSGRQATIMLNGQSISAIQGDMHDDDFDSYALSYGTLIGGTAWGLTLYPSANMYNTYVSRTPEYGALAVVLSVTSFAALFAVYELLVRRRSAALIKELAVNLQEVTVLKAEVEQASEVGNRQKDEFVSMVSHEIRTPLNAVQGASTLLQETKPLSSEQKELLALLDAGTAHMVMIVEDILLHGGLMSGNFPVVLAPLTLVPSVLDPAITTLTLQPAMQNKLRSITLTRQVAADVPAMVMGDSTRLLQVLTNLLGNALKFTPSGGTVLLSVDVVREAPPMLSGSVPASGQWLRFRVADNGVGVPSDKLSRIFLPFTQADLSTMRTFGGTVRTRGNIACAASPGLTRSARGATGPRADHLQAHCGRDGWRAGSSERRGGQGHDAGVHHPAAACGGGHARRGQPAIVSQQQH